MVYDFVLVGGQGGERVRVSDRDRGIEARRVRGGGVRSHPALALFRRPKWRARESRPRRRDRQLVEAGERVVFAIAVEELEARHEAIGAEDMEQEEQPLVGAAASAGGAKVTPAHEQRIGLQGEDIVV